MNIELVKPPSGTFGFDRGERKIMVDGVEWGRTIVTYHGCHGQKHCFQSVHGHGNIQRIERGAGRRAERGVDVAVWTEKRARFKTDYQSAPIWTRVAQQVERLIAEGLLIHPDEEKRRIDQRNADWLRRRNAKAEEERKAFHTRAAIALDPVRDVLTSQQVDTIVARIITAMEWAQSQ